MAGKPFQTTLRILAALSAAGLVLSLAAGGWAWWRLKTSLPVLDGEAPLPGLLAPATIARDALGVPSIRASSEADAYRALGYCHAQDRYFQMDTLRRRSAGELSELVGDATLEMDKDVLRHDFRRLARETWKRLPEDQRALAQAYTEGVNAGLASLGAPPWEYAALRSQPAPWLPEDCLLLGFTMTLELQDQGDYERSLSILRDTLGDEVLRFLSPQIGPDDAAADGSKAALPPIPGPKVINLRRETKKGDPDVQVISRHDGAWRGVWREGAGSNAMVLDGAHAGGAAALVANDMHLALAVPNIWYRASLSWPSSPGSGEHTGFTGLTLPGTPVPVAGSNGKVAWGFTASYADTCDLVPVEHVAGDPDYYKSPRGEQVIERRSHSLAIRGSEPAAISHEWSLWGPVVGRNAKGQRLSLLWVAHQPGAIDLRFSAITRCRNAAEALELGRSSGLPALNMLVADSQGTAAWTLAGRLPARRGHSGRLPVSHVFGDRGWDGLLPADAAPSLVAPREGYFTSANERLFAGEKLAVLGDGGYESPHRARQLRAGVAALAERGSATPRDLLAVQLDDRALALQPWRELLVSTLSTPGLAPNPGRARVLARVQAWNGRASAQTSGYAEIRIFSQLVQRRVLGPIVEACSLADSSFNLHRLNSEPAVWALLRERPLHLLAPQYKDWEALLLECADRLQVIEDRTWDDFNTASIRHPLLESLPRWLSAWADMPEEPLVGDDDLPRVVRPSFGASERFAVAPGREHEAVLHMPGGQSAHPLSPFFRAGHEAWVKGTPLPFAAGPATHTLVLTP